MDAYEKDAQDGLDEPNEAWSAHEDEQRDVKDAMRQTMADRSRSEHCYKSPTEQWQRMKWPMQSTTAAAMSSFAGLAAEIAGDIEGKTRMTTSLSWCRAVDECCTGRAGWSWPRSCSGSTRWATRGSGLMALPLGRCSGSMGSSGRGCSRTLVLSRLLSA